MLAELALAGNLLAGQSGEGAHCAREGAAPIYDCMGGQTTLTVFPAETNPDGTTFSTVKAHDNNTGETVFDGSISQATPTLDFVTRNGMRIHGEPLQPGKSVMVTESAPPRPGTDTSGLKTGLNDQRTSR